ncbi:hypothetical protein EVAR_19085_1 [Eumeta japonica]|uniref:Uncharacterized protein n=1 Tax=Eumeta variegata TaxID=151549 RepID=A0A4C1UQA6_EUMVA|nr:hypothetical protein EVAR_19085_1 [Eumeta japonica]
MSKKSAKLQKAEVTIRERASTNCAQDGGYGSSHLIGQDEGRKRGFIGSLIRSPPKLLVKVSRRTELRRSAETDAGVFTATQAVGDFARRASLKEEIGHPSQSGLGGPRLGDLSGGSPRSESQKFMPVDIHLINRVASKIANLAMGAKSELEALKNISKDVKQSLLLATGILTAVDRTHSAEESSNEGCTDYVSLWFIQSNLQRSKLTTTELLVEVERRKITVALVQEPYIGNIGELRRCSVVQKLYRVVQKTTLRRASVKAVISDVDLKEDQTFNNENIVATVVEAGNCRIGVVSVYKGDRLLKWVVDVTACSSALLDGVGEWQVAIFRNLELFLAMANKCLKLGHFPRTWKVAVIKVIPNLGNENYACPKSYCSIGLLPMLGKTLERMLVGRLWWHLMTKLQATLHYFTPESGTVDALYDLMTHIYKELNLKRSF